jgi:RNA polymerase sigma factor (sigma-70 family)
MPTRPLEALVRHVRRIAGASDPDPIGDADLMARFNASRDEAAFAEIVQRHGPLVWAICRTNLNGADADDAFQATFLVLARKAKSIRRPSSLACWLSGVARKTVHAMRVRRDRRREVTLAADLPERSANPSESGDTREILAEELARLPEKFRLPILLCYYQGLTNEEAARRLNWPHGTVCGRLARARELLRQRLSRRGITLSIGALSAAQIGQPAELIAATLRICSTASSGLKPSVIKLAEATMHAMWIGKVKMAVGTAVVLAALGTGTGWVLTPAPAQVRGQSPGVTRLAPQVQIQPTPDYSKIDENEALDLLRKAMELAKPSPLAKKNANDDALREAFKERHRTAASELSLRLQVFQAGARGGSIDVLLDALRRFTESEIALGSAASDAVTATKRTVQLAQAIVAVNWARFNVGQIAQQDLAQCRYFMLDAQIKLAEVEAKTGSVK